MICKGLGDRNLSALPICSRLPASPEGFWRTKAVASEKDIQQGHPSVWVAYMTNLSAMQRHLLLSKAKKPDHTNAGSLLRYPHSSAGNRPDLQIHTSNTNVTVRHNSGCNDKNGADRGCPAKPTGSNSALHLSPSESARCHLLLLNIGVGRVPLPTSLPGSLLSSYPTSESPRTFDVASQRLVH